jgi:hypothetical protein
MIPSQGYLANVWGAASPATASTTPIGPMASGPLPANLFGLPGDPAPIAMPQEMAPPPVPHPQDPHVDEALGMSVAGPPPPMSTPGPPPAAAPAGPPPPAPRQGGYAQIAGARDMGNAYPLLGVPGGGVITAHELERRGPSLLAAQGNRNEASEQTIDRVNARNQDMALQEQAVLLDQERQARAREAAMQQSFAERDEEMAQRQADFDGTVKQLGKMGTLDRDRFWASRSTGQKIAGFIEMALSGFNRAPSLLQKRIDDDVKAQEFAFYATRDTAQAKQTAFAQAMQKYQNADAARSMARAAGIDTVQAQLAQMGAKWKGTDAANRADMASAALQDEKMMQIANGVQFIPAQSTGRRFYDPRTGLSYSEAEAKAMSAKVDERNFENLKQDAGIGGQMTVEQMKAQTELQKTKAAAQKDVGERIVRLPNGDVIQAPSDKEAGTLRDLSSSSHDVRRLLARVKEIKSSDTWRMSPGDQGELESIQQQLRTSFSVAAQLGALSKDDVKIADGAVGDITSVSSSGERALGAYQAKVESAWRNRVKTYENSPHTARGELPPEAAASFTPAGGKK